MLGVIQAPGQRMHYRRNRYQDGSLGPVPRISMEYFYMSKKDEEATDNPFLILLNEEPNEKYSRATDMKSVGIEKM